MRNSKIIFSLIFLSFLLLGCKKKDKTPKEYFSFDANGVHHDYPQDKTKMGLFGGGVSTLGAGSTGFGLGYQIYAFSLHDLSAPGTITFNFAEDGIPTEDTIILDGIKAIATIDDFLNMGNNFRTNSSYNGRIIFLKRNNKILEGTFNFQAQQQYDSSIIHITNGKFSIIPTL